MTAVTMVPATSSAQTPTIALAAPSEGGKFSWREVPTAVRPTANRISSPARMENGAFDGSA